MEQNPHHIKLESNPYEIELAGNNNAAQGGGALGHNEYGSRFNLPSRESISRKGKYIVAGVQSRGGCRLTICLVGVLLCWLSALQVANAFVEILFTPPQGGPQVEESWDQFKVGVDLERQRNLNCVNVTLTRCGSILVGDFSGAAADTEQIAAENDWLIGNVTLLQQKCANLQQEKIGIIQTYKQGLLNASLPVLWTSNCSNETNRNLDDMYTDPTLTANQATQATAAYGNSQDSKWARAWASVKARNDYDAAYWANKTAQLKTWYESQPSLINLPAGPTFNFGSFNTDLSNYWACATLSNATCTLGNGLRDRANAVYATFTTRFNTARNSLNQQINSSQVYLNAAGQKISDWTAYANSTAYRLANARATLQAAVPTCPGCQAWIDSIPGQNPNFNIPSIPNVGSYSVPDLTTFPLPSLDALMAGLDFGNATAAIRGKLANMSAAVGSTVDGWSDTVGANLNNCCPWNASLGVNFGYNPPAVDVNTTGVNNLTDAYKNQTSQKLADVTARIQYGGSSGSGSNYTYQDAVNTFVQGLNQLSTTDYSYATLGGTFDLDLWFVSVDWVRFFCYFFDYAWRIYYSGRIFIRYWFGSAGTMPPIDIRSYRTTKATPLHIRIARYATHPLVLFGGLLVMAVLIVSTILGVYVPLVNDYIQGCVKSNSVGTGTLLSDNVYAAAFNAAVLQGNRALSQGLNDYDTNRANLCGSTQQEASDGYATAQHQYRIVRDNFATVQQLLYQMEVCTDPNTWTEIERLKAYPKNYSFLQLTSHQLPIGSWHVQGCEMSDFDAMGQLKPPTINCTSLPSCNAGCTVDVSAIQGLSHKASCETEWYVHTSILKAVCTVIVFIFWNVCRTLLLDGLVRIYWDKLVRGTGLNFYSTCNQEGQIDTDTEEQLQVAIKKANDQYVWMGRVYILMSILLNIPYIVFCILLNINLTYPY